MTLMPNFQVFLINACRGDGDRWLADSSSSAMADCFVWYSSEEGYGSYRNSKGAFFLQEFSKARKCVTQLF